VAVGEIGSVSARASQTNPLQGAGARVIR
jgi:hypothetical protein